MINTKDAGTANSAGSIQLPRLNPRQIAVLVLPDQDVTVMDASDAEFQAFINTRNIQIENDEGRGEWSFDDRIGVINHYRKYGVDLFAVPNTNNSAQEQKQFANNSNPELFGELFDGGGVAPQAAHGTTELIGVAAIRDDIDSLLAEMEKSSSGEQKEFESE